MCLDIGCKTATVKNSSMYFEALCHRCQMHGAWDWSRKWAKCCMSQSFISSARKSMSDRSISSGSSVLGREVAEHWRGEGGGQALKSRGGVGVGWGGCKPPCYSASSLYPGCCYCHMALFGAAILALLLNQCPGLAPCLLCLSYATGIWKFVGLTISKFTLTYKLSSFS